MSQKGEMAGAMRQEPGPARRLRFVLHPAWLAFIRYCEELRFGDIERLRIQDGVPVLAEETRKKVRFIE